MKITFFILLFLPNELFGKTINSRIDTIVVEKVVVHNDTIFISNKDSISANSEDIHYADWVAAIAAMLNIIISILLWRTTQNSILLSYEQVKRTEVLTEMNSIQTFHKNFRELYSSILNDDDYLTILASTRQVDVVELKRNYLASFLINHAYELFLMHNKSMFTQEVWYTILIDMQTLFKWEFIINRWEKVKGIYVYEFQDFVKTNILKK